jgi:hypothetical protein
MNITTTGSIAYLFGCFHARSSKPRGGISDDGGFVDLSKQAMPDRNAQKQQIFQLDLKSGITCH